MWGILSILSGRNAMQICYVSRLYKSIKTPTIHPLNPLIRCTNYYRTLIVMIELIYADKKPRRFAKASLRIDMIELIYANKKPRRFAKASLRIP